MRLGSLIVDAAADYGGNCELTQAGKDITKHGVRIFGHTNLASTVPGHASQMLANNFFAFIKLFVKDGEINFDWDDPILKDTALGSKGGKK